MQDNSSNSDGYTTEIPGGVTRYTVGQPIPSKLTIGTQAESHSVGTSNRVDQGTLRHTVGGEVTRQGTTHATSGSLIDTSSILGTYRSSFGSPSRAFREDGTIAVDPSQPDGLRTDMRTAERMGLVRRGPDGQYTEAFVGTPSTADIERTVLGDQKEEDAAVFDLFEPSQEREYVAMLAPYEQPATDLAHVVGSMAAASGKDVSSIAVEVGKQLARDQGGDPAVHTANAAKAATFYQQQVGKAVTQVGILPDAHEYFYEWLRSTSNNRDDMSAALVQLTSMRSTQAFKALAERFLTSGSPSASYLRAAGIPSRNGRNGLEAQIGGEWVEAAGLRFEHGK